MPAPPRIRLLPLAAIALALAMIYLSWSPPRDPDAAPREAATAAATAPTRADATPRSASPNTAAAAPNDVPAISVSGKITGPDGAPLGDVAVELQPRGDATGTAVRRTRSDRHGEFRFDAIIPGRPYQLRVAPTDTHTGYDDDSVTFNAAAPRLDIVLERIVLVDADGIIVDTSQAPVANFTLRLRSASANVPERVITSDPTGYFRLDDFPAGGLEISTSGRDFYRIGGLELAADAYNKLTLVVDRGDYHLSGRVGDDAGRPISDARVTLKGVLRQGDSHTYTYRSTLSDDQGEFAFTELGSYRYTLGIHAAGFETQVRDHEFRSFSERLEISLQPLPVD